MLIELFITLLNFWQNCKHFISISKKTFFGFAVGHSNSILQNVANKMFLFMYLLQIRTVRPWRTSFLTELCLICGSAKKFFFSKSKSYYFGEFALLVRFMNRTTSGIVLSEFVLSGDPLYINLKLVLGR